MDNLTSSRSWDKAKIHTHVRHSQGHYTKRENQGGASCKYFRKSIVRLRGCYAIHSARKTKLRWRPCAPSSNLIKASDATSEIYYAQLAEEETTATVMAGLRAVIEQKGLFCSLYSDRGAHFWYTPKSGGKVDYERPTQVGRAMKELGVHMIPSYSPQARGRSERNFSTWQGRLPQELRLRGIRTLEGANKFLNEHYIAEFNRRFTVPAAQRGTAFISCRHRNLEMIFTQRFERTVDRDNTVSFYNLIMQLERAKWRPTLAGCKVIIHQHLDQTLTLMIAGHRVGHYSAE